MFFETIDFMLRHWFFFLVYVVLFWTTVNRFFRDVVMNSGFYDVLENLYWRPKNSRFYFLRRIVMRLIVMRVIVILMYVPLFFVAPLLSFILHRLDKKEKERRLEIDRKGREEASARKQKEREEENARRMEARKKWVLDNTVKLYFNSVDGVTAVLRPDVYIRVQEETRKGLRNECWEKENVLCPSADTIVFVTSKGKKIVEKNLGGEDHARFRMVGLLSDLDEIVARGMVTLVHDPRIFVPYTNESILSFHEQKQKIRDCQRINPYYFLVEMQAPRELLPR